LAVIANCDPLARLKSAKSLHFAFFPILFEAPSLRPRLAATRAESLWLSVRQPPFFFREAQPQEENFETISERLSLSALCCGRAARVDNDDPGF